MKKWASISLIMFLVVFLLSACGTSEGDKFRFKEMTIVTSTEENYLQLSTFVGDDGKLGFDDEKTFPIFKGTEVEVIKVSKHKNGKLLMIRELNGDRKDSVMWIGEADLKAKAEKIK
jgi:hypothetical protein